VTVLLAVQPLTDVSLWVRTNLLEIILYILGAALLTRFATSTQGKITTRLDARAGGQDALVRSEAAKHQHAVVQVVTWTLLVLIYCLAAVLIVQKLGIPITGFVAPATVVGVALGFGAQRIVQDVLAGFFLVTERQYGFGDVIRLSVLGAPTQMQGTVEEVTLRITRIRSLDGEVITTPNGQIVQVINLSRDWARAVVDVPVPAAIDVNRANEVLREVGAQAFADPQLHDLLLDTPTVMGVESLSVDQFNIRLVARTLPGKQFEVSRALRSRITEAFLRHGIVVPATVDSAPPSGADQ
jgi:small conductance mechanosensitive channel